MSRMSGCTRRVLSLFVLAVGLGAVGCGMSELGFGDDTVVGSGGTGGSAGNVSDAPYDGRGGNDGATDSRNDGPRSDVAPDGIVDGPPTDGAPDGGPDGRPDAPLDGRPDAPLDGRPDAPLDGRPDAPLDAGRCTTSADCDDLIYCTMDRCSGGFCTHSARDMDQDSYVSVDCGGNDCNDTNPNVHPGATENCTDGVDNDCNGVADCFDPACANAPSCGCVPNPNGENCTNGIDDDCNGMVDCNDPACIGTPVCGCTKSEAGHCQNGIDDDCDGATDCADFDCAFTPECQCSSHPEICSNGIDDNCDLRVDCADPQCEYSSLCRCVPPGRPEVCNDQRDNDCNGLVDCADPACTFTSFCTQCVSEVCNDKKDNDCNGLIDCADPACHLDPSCEPVQEICNNKIDDDFDGLVDCEDPDCKTNPYCVAEQSNCLTAKLISSSGRYTGDTTGHKNINKGTCGGDAGEAVFYFVLSVPTKVHLDTVGTSFDSVLYARAGSCDHGHEIGCDDDSGGSWAGLLNFTILYPGTYYVFVDGFTVDPVGGPNEGPFVLHAQFTPNPKEVCDNGIDDDGDIYVDCADSDCTAVGKCLNCNGGRPPRPEIGVVACTDGRDNDCDGKVDCADSDCNASDYYKAECCNGRDDNGNGITDDFACRCSRDSECASGQMCYTHTVYACGYPCTDFYGDICPFIAPGSYCSTASLECEFP